MAQVKRYLWLTLSTLIMGLLGLSLVSVWLVMFSTKFRGGFFEMFFTGGILIFLVAAIPSVLGAVSTKLVISGSEKTKNTAVILAALGLMAAFPLCGFAVFSVWWALVDPH